MWYHFRIAEFQIWKYQIGNTSSHYNWSKKRVKRYNQTSIKLVTANSASNWASVLIGSVFFFSFSLKNHRLVKLIDTLIDNLCFLKHARKLMFIRLLRCSRIQLIFGSFVIQTQAQTQIRSHICVRRTLYQFIRRCEKS